MPLVKAQLLCIDNSNKNITFQFNPNKLTFSLGTSWEDAKETVTGANNQQTEITSIDPKQGIPVPKFKHINATTIDISEVYFDASEGDIKLDDGQNKERKIADIIELLHQAVYPKNIPVARDGKYERPPIYLFIWGEINYLRCYINSLTYDIIMFSPDGTPLRIKATLKLTQVPDSFENQTLPAGRDGKTRWGGNVAAS